MGYGSTPLALHLCTLLFVKKVFKKIAHSECHLLLFVLHSFAVLVGGPLPRGHEFELHDARFHWGRENQRGSEHTVNFKAFPMEVSMGSPCTVFTFLLKILNHCLKTCWFHFN